MSTFQIPVLSTMVGWLADLMALAVQFFYDLTDAMGYPSYGVAIIILTIVIKVALLPFALKQIRSMKGMQELQPRIQALQRKYKNDRMKLSQEMQHLYRENNISPLAGCLPLLIQMPFLISIFYALQGFQYDPAHESFLWLNSLASKDPTYILPILSALTTYAISRQTQPKDIQGSQKAMTYFMPLFIGYISINFPSGLVIYWVVSNLFQLVQQTIMFRDSTVQKFLKGSDKKGVVTIHADGTRDNTPHKQRARGERRREMREEKEAARESIIERRKARKEHRKKVRKELAKAIEGDTEEESEPKEKDSK
jgi:YidC/Oxa1 family membrane protein insertase